MSHAPPATYAPGATTLECLLFKIFLNFRHSKLYIYFLSDCMEPQKYILAPPLPTHHLTTLFRTDRQVER